MDSWLYSYGILQCILASEYAVSKTLHKLFKNDPDLTSE